MFRSLCNRQNWAFIFSSPSANSCGEKSTFFSRQIIWHISICHFKYRGRWAFSLIALCLSPLHSCEVCSIWSLKEESSRADSEKLRQSNNCFCSWRYWQCAEAIKKKKPKHTLQPPQNTEAFRCMLSPEFVFIGRTIYNSGSYVIVHWDRHLTWALVTTHCFMSCKQ